MTTLAASNETLAQEGAHDQHLEELMDRVLECIHIKEAGIRHVARAVHEARRRRQAGDLDGALRAMAMLDATDATSGEVRWAYSEWLDITRRRFRGCNALLYSQGAGRAAVLLRRRDGVLEVAATLGMRWQTGMVLSRRSPRGLRPLDGRPSC